MIKYLLALCALVAVVAASGPWSNCGKPDDHFKINSLTISPAELAPGQEFTIALDGSLDEQVTGGNAVISVQFLGITVFTKTYAVCDLMSKAGKTCPVASGPYQISQSESFPGGVPKGSYTGKLVITDQNNEEVACLTFNMKVTAPALTEAVLDDEFIKHINSVQKKWTAARNPRFEGMTIGDIKKMLRTRVGDSLSTFPATLGEAPVELPASFDARQQWPNCIHPIRDQQQCGSCWAFSASEALSDRFCIASSGSVNVVLSPQWLVSCDTTNLGCQGGYLDATWQYLESSGIPTDACLPYTSGGGDSGTCSGKCADGSAPKMYKVKSGSTIHPMNVNDIESALVSGGPLQVAFSVYQDFMHYSGGVYEHTSGSLLGGHAVKLVGYGTSNGTPYWLIANSWGTSWGLSGFFMIERGVNMCGIESQVYAGAPAL